MRRAPFKGPSLLGVLEVVTSLRRRALLVCFFFGGGGVAFDNAATLRLYYHCAPHLIRVRSTFPFVFVFFAGCPVLFADLENMVNASLFI